MFAAFLRGPTTCEPLCVCMYAMSYVYVLCLKTTSSYSAEAFIEAQLGMLKELLTNYGTDYVSRLWWDHYPSGCGGLAPCPNGSFPDAWPQFVNLVREVGLHFITFSFFITGSASAPVTLVIGIICSGYNFVSTLNHPPFVIYIVCHVSCPHPP